MKRTLVLAVLLSLSFGLFALAADVDAAKAKPKNIIIMIADGMGYNAMYAASLYFTGIEEGFYWQKLNQAAGMCTFASGGSYDPQAMWASAEYCAGGATDSAAAATAMSCGIKTYSGAIGMDMAQQPVEHIMERAEALGMSTGVVTSVEFSHATPAGFVAHNVSRNNYADIAVEMLESDCDVIMGAGHPYYDNDGKRQGSALSFKYIGGQEAWSDLRSGKYGTFITKRKHFQKYMTGNTPDRLVGVAQVYQTLQQSRSSVAYAGPAAEEYPYQTPLNENVPTLQEMTAAALNVLDDNEKGFVLMVEGGAIDWAGHANQTARSIEETLDFNGAVETVMNWVAMNSSWDDTLLIITADHETGYMIARGASSSRKSPSNKGIGTMPKVDWLSGDHTNQLVPIFMEGSAAKGMARRAKMNDSVHGKYMDNTQIAGYVFSILK